MRKEDDTPISLHNYEQIDSRTEHYCPFCQLKLSRLVDRSGLNPSYYCSKCVIEYPDESDVKSKSYMLTPQKFNPTPYTAYAPEPELGKKKTEIKDGLAELQKRGVRITSYKESRG